MIAAQLRLAQHASGAVRPADLDRVDARGVAEAEFVEFLRHFEGRLLLLLPGWSASSTKDLLFWSGQTLSRVAHRAASEEAAAGDPKRAGWWWESRSTVEFALFDAVAEKWPDDTAQLAAVAAFEIHDRLDRAERSRAV